MSADYVSLTEIAGDEVSSEQVHRITTRYLWAGSYCKGRRVLEVACGSGQGIGYLASCSRQFAAGDYSSALLTMAKNHYGERFSFARFDAQHLPFKNGIFDVVLILEALYYLPDQAAFLTECRRVLAPQGQLLIATANKDLFDFTASPHSHGYLGVVELAETLTRFGFQPTFFGDAEIAEASARQRLLRPLKALASKLGLVPKTMHGKKLLKRLVFGTLVRMPAEIAGDTVPYHPPTPLLPDRPDRAHKVILCAATRLDNTVGSPLNSHSGIQ